MLSISTENLARHQRLKQLIMCEIDAAPNQCISFSRFMELALLAPSLGYYQSTANWLGRVSDFTTAPEISPLWSRCLARYCAPILKTLSPSNVTIVEMGAGTGRMAADLLMTLETLGSLPDRYVIVEVSSRLRQYQETNLQQWIPHLADRIEYRAMLPDEPIEGIIVANEVMDALPVDRFIISQGVLYESWVGRKNDQLIEKKQKVSTKHLSDRLPKIQLDYLYGVGDYISEVHLSLAPWFESIQKCLKKGCMVLIDYGRVAREYYHPSRRTGTLRCYYQHQCYTDPLQWVGLQDITSDVNFTEVAVCGVQAGLTVNAFLSQSAFLLANGLLETGEICYSNDAYLALKGKVNQLMSPSEMGELCKVMVLSRGITSELLTLEEYDKRFTL